LWKNLEDLTERQHARLAWIAQTDPRLRRADLLKEDLRHVFSIKGTEGKHALDRRISWARRCRIPVFVQLARRIVKHRQSVDAALDYGLCQGLIESVNTKIRLLARIALGFRSPHALIALACSPSGGHRRTLPGRTNPRIRQYGPNFLARTGRRKLSLLVSSHNDSAFKWPALSI